MKKRWRVVAYSETGQEHEIATTFTRLGAEHEQDKYGWHTMLDGKPPHEVKIERCVLTS